MYIENDLEQQFREKLEEHGFLVYKLKTPGRAGVMDRMIIRPSYSPGPPLFVELKQTRGHLDKRQKVLAEDWRKRGVNVLEAAYGPDILALADQLIDIIKYDRERRKRMDVL